jgi:hypothetical protein
MRAAGTKFAIQGTSLSADDRTGALPRVWLEAAGWVVLVTVLWGTDLLVKISERNQTGIGKDDFFLISEQVTSAVAVLVMILFVIRWLELFPLRRAAWPQAVIGHTAGTVLFAFGHYALMVALRMAWYQINDHHFVWRDPFVANLIVEYQKDIKIYFGIVIIATAYQMYRRSRSAPAPQPSNRIIVQTGSGESVLRFEQIDYLEAARNYVAVHAEGREYLTRDTMANVTGRLSGGPFARTHRSFIVNVDKVSDIRTVDSKQRVFLVNGKDVPLSRSFRDQFTKKIAG